MTSNREGREGVGERLRKRKIKEKKQVKLKKQE